MSGAFDPERMLAVLDTHQVRFVVVGGFAAWGHGAPILRAVLEDEGH